MKKERVEDLGIIYEKLDRVLIEFEEKCPFFDSKHNYDDFEKIFENPDKIYDFHISLRYMKDELYNILNIARGDDERD